MYELCYYWSLNIVLCNEMHGRDEWVPATTAWRVLGLRIEERPPMCRVAANILKVHEIWYTEC